MLKKTWVAAALVVALAGPASHAALAGRAPAAVRAQAESSLAVAGTVTVRVDGTVAAYTVDPEAPLGDSLKAFLERNVMAWRFEPVLVDGKPATVRVPMRLRLVAKPAGDGKASVAIASTWFGDSTPPAPGSVVSSARLTPPKYPGGALMIGASGVVYLVVEVGQDGRVSNVGAEQVNLWTAGTERQMTEVRKQFTDASVRAARTWRFTPPANGDDVAAGRWLVRVPVEFRLDDRPTVGSQAHQWDTYIPGPLNRDMPWAAERLKTAGSPDALPGSGVFPLKQGARLLSPAG